jgi:hypothetical protein
MVHEDRRFSARSKSRFRPADFYAPNPSNMRIANCSSSRYRSVRRGTDRALHLTLQSRLDWTCGRDVRHERRVWRRYAGSVCNLGRRCSRQSLHSLQHVRVRRTKTMTAHQACGSYRACVIPGTPLRLNDISSKTLGHWPGSSRSGRQPGQYPIRWHAKQGNAANLLLPSTQNGNPISADSPNVTI